MFGEINFMKKFCSFICSNKLRLTAEVVSFRYGRRRPKTRGLWLIFIQTPGKCVNKLMIISSTLLFSVRLYKFTSQHTAVMWLLLPYTPSLNTLYFLRSSLSLLLACFLFHVSCCKAPKKTLIPSSKPSLICI